MPYVLGIDIGSTTTAAAVVRPQGSSWARPEVVPLSSKGPSVPSVLLMSTNRSITVADPDSTFIETCNPRKTIAMIAVARCRPWKKTR